MKHTARDHAVRILSVELYFEMGGCAYPESRQNSAARSREQGKKNAQKICRKSPEHGAGACAQAQTPVRKMQFN